MVEDGFCLGGEVFEGGRWGGGVAGWRGWRRRPRRLDLGREQGSLELADLIILAVSMRGFMGGVSTGSRGMRFKERTTRGEFPFIDFVYNCASNSVLYIVPT